MIKKTLLIILDGVGIRSGRDNNAFLLANTPNLDYYRNHYAFGTINASENFVGLPSGQFGNSEVGHLNIGAGRIVRQDISKIDYAIETKEFYTNQAFITAMNDTPSGNLHIMGLISNGGVHSHINHILELIKLANQNPNLKQIWIHAFLDGRDTPPKSAINFMQQLEQAIESQPKTKIATMAGRYYAMDRDKRWERVKLAYDACAFGVGESGFDSIEEALNKSYNANITDEFVTPKVFNNYTGVKAGDSVIFANFRADRACELTSAFINPEFKEFQLGDFKLAHFVTMTRYKPEFNTLVAFPPESITNTLGEVVSNLGLKQLRVAETEKYPHITYFLNGGEEPPFKGEERILINSPREVATYDLKPEMSLPEVAEKLIQGIQSDNYALFISNFANGDMVGHTGNLAAAIKAVEAIDFYLGRVVDSMLENDGEVLIIADHGNCEEMYDAISHQPHTQHTTNLVPFLYIGRKAKILPMGSLKDVAPSVLAIMNVPQPSEMTGHSLIDFI